MKATLYRKKTKQNKRYWNKITRKVSIQSGSAYKKIFCKFLEDGKYIDWTSKKHNALVAELEDTQD